MCISLGLDKDLKVIIPTEIWDAPEATPTDVERVFRNNKVNYSPLLVVCASQK